MAVFGHPKPTEEDADRALACALELVDALSDWKRHSNRNGLPALHAAVGLHYGTVIGGVLDSGCHSEFTVIGDTVNLAQRLETMAKSLATPLVVSSDVIAHLHSTVPSAAWVKQPLAMLHGRREPIDVWYIDRRDSEQTDHCYETEGLQTATQRSDFQSVPRVNEVDTA